MRFEKLTQPIAAGGAWRLGMAAAELQIVASSYPLRVTLYRGGTVIGSGSNVLAGDYFRGVDFDFVELFSDDAQDVTILLTDGESGSKRIVGEVSVINGEFSRTLSGAAIVGSLYIGAAVGLYSAAQFSNPIGSGKNLVITSLDFASDTPGAVTVGGHDALLSAPIVNGRKLFSPFDNSVITMHSAQLASFSPDIRLSAYFIMAADTKSIEFKSPLVIPPGAGFAAVKSDVNATLNFGFVGYLESIN